MEYLDVLNQQGEKTGEVVSYDKAHEEGIMHRAVHVWFVNSQKELLLQKRNSTRRAYPNHWDISAAGHVSAGEMSLRAAQKETREELGLDLPDSAFAFLFTIEEHVVLNEGSYIANEFQDVYLVSMDVDVSKLSLQSEEVEEVRWLSLEEFREWLGGKGESVVPHPDEHKRLLGYLSDTF